MLPIQRHGRLTSTIERFALVFPIPRSKGMRSKTVNSCQMML